MTILGLCFDSNTSGAVHGHDAGLVALSILVAILASYCALDMAERLRAAGPRGRPFWMVMSGMTLGVGIWSMHFIAMTAFEAPLEEGYAPDLTLISGVVAVAGVIAGLAALGRKPTALRLAASGLLVGLAVVAMHYIGMAAMRVPGQVVYRPGLFGVAVVVAITAATVALWLAVVITRTWQRIIAALVMAAAICGMHYVAMAGTAIIFEPTTTPPVTLVSKTTLAAIVATGVFTVIAVGLVLAYLDRRLERQSVQEAARLRTVNTALEEARVAAEAAALAKSQFLATMSHEIRTPMNGVLGMLEIALQSDLDPIQHEQIVTARDSAASLLHILNDILDYSKLEAGQLALEVLSFQIRPLVDEVVSFLAPQAQQKAISLATEIDAATPDWILGDPTRLRQILLNLAGNAVKFTETGGVVIAVAYGCDGGTDRIRISVRDTGAGIAEAARKRLFTRFTQADASTTRRFGGTGLGLAICRELVTRMGGEIGVDSEPGKGSNFWFVLPARIGEGSDQRPAKADVRVDWPNAPARPSGLRILVAEDNPVNQKVLRAMMLGLGNELVFVGDGAQAVAAVRNGRFDMVLMDISMPVMDGPTAAREIRELRGDAAAIPIIALTANAMTGDREAYLACGMNDYVSKPISRSELLAAIARQSPGAQFVVEAAPEAALESSEAPAPSVAPGRILDEISAELDGLLASLDDLAPKQADRAA